MSLLIVPFQGFAPAGISVEAELCAMSVATNLTVSPLLTDNTAGSKTIIPLVPVLSIFTTCSAAKAGNDSENNTNNADIFFIVFPIFLK
jgi:hypothetical protein